MPGTGGSGRRGGKGSFEMDNRILTPSSIDAYAASLRMEERAEETVRKYRRDMQSFAAWLGDRPVTKESAADWKASLLGSGLSAATVNARLAALNGLLRFLGLEDCRVKFLKLQHRPFRDASRDLTREDYARLLAAARENSQPELALLLETICAAGLRVSEVRYVTVEAARQGRADVRLKGKIRTILLPEKLCRRLLGYAKQQKTASGAIFRAADGKELSRFQIWKAMKRLARLAGVESSKVFPHNLRHLFAVTFYRATRDIVRLADLLGHSSVNTTRIYLVTTGTEHARQIEQLGLLT